ncbi:MAG: hypothetical protein ACK56F_22400, partial [bacterium]
NPLFVWDDSMRKSFDETACFDFHGFTYLNDETVFGDIHFDDLTRFSLAMKTSLRVRPLNLISSLISIEGRSKAS